jgi:peptidoglycan hydrolase CwlO-like protein
MLKIHFNKIIVNEGTGNMKKSSRIMPATLGIVCIMLTATLAGTIFSFNSTITTKEQTINNLQFEIEENNNTITELNLEIADKNSQIENLTYQKDIIQDWLDSNTTILSKEIDRLENLLAESQQTRARAQAKTE